MKLLLDTHLLLWAAAEPQKMSAAARAVIDDPANELFFSPASLWEVAIKAGLGRADFQVDAGILRRALLDNGYQELPITGQHVVFTADLPALHKDPFDRILVAQSSIEGVVLVTADATLAQYPGPIRRV